MKIIESTDVYAEMASVRDQLCDLRESLSQLAHRARQDGSTEGQLLSATLRHLQTALIEAERQAGMIATCYA